MHIFTVTNTTLLGPLLKRNHIKSQFIVRILRFLCYKLKIHIGIFETYAMNALHNANSPMGSKMFFLHSKYGINFQSHSLAHCIKVATTVEQLHSVSNCLIEQLRITLRPRCNKYIINEFIHR